MGSDGFIFQQRCRRVENCPVGENILVLAAPGFPAAQEVRNWILRPSGVIVHSIYECRCCYRLKVLVVEINEVSFVFKLTAELDKMNNII